MRNTPIPPPFERRSNDDLIDDLCIALRNVGVWDYSLPKDERAVSYVNEVKEIYRELKKRQVQFTPRIELLSQETKWQMSQLLEECLQYPSVIPYVREADGVRRALRCSLCGARERPIDDERYRVCDTCLQECITAINAKKPLKGVVLYRSYNPDRRCRHAGEETVLIGFEDYEEGWLLAGYCRECLEQELARRQPSKSAS
jgi:hypothetical protein